MTEKKLPFTKDKLEQISTKFPTPFHIYDEKGMREYARKFVNAFSWNLGFKEYFAIKAAPNPFLMKILHQENFGIDCSSMAELVLAEKVGLRGEEIMFTSNDTPAYEYKKALELGAIINLDDFAHISYLEEKVGLPELVCFRYNPDHSKRGMPLLVIRRRPNMVLPANSSSRDTRSCATRGSNVLVSIPWLLPMNWIQNILSKRPTFFLN